MVIISGKQDVNYLTFIDHHCMIGLQYLFHVIEGGERIEFNSNSNRTNESRRACL